jgi:anti-anti-sigma factor
VQEGDPSVGMVARVRAHDWSRTPLGPAGQWPQSLQTASSICLSSGFPMHVWWGRELTVIYNDAYVPAMGDKHPGALGRSAAEVWAEAWGELGPMAESVLAGRGATFSEDQLLFLRRHGYLEETYWTFSYSPVQDESGDVGGVFVAVSDTTTRVVGERRLRVLRDLGELSTVSAGTAEDASRAVVDVLSRHRAEVPFAVVHLRGEDEGELRLAASSGVQVGSAVAPRTLRTADDAWWRVAAGGPAEVVGLDGGNAVDAAAVGPAVPTEALVLPLAVAGRPEPVGVLVVGVNPYRALDADYRAFLDLVAVQLSTAVTDALAYEAERRRAEALAELDRAKTDFFSNVSHEFRTPLTLIMGPVAELRSAPAVMDDARLREELEVVHRNGLRLGKLVNSLLDFSRLQAGRVEARFEPVDLALLTGELTSVFRSAVQRAGLDYEVDLPPLHQPVFVDRDMWEKVVLNLLSNALKFTFEGRITVMLQQRDRAAVLTVADTGTGIPATELPRLFERFHRVERAQARSGEGSGIGLAMVRELVALHGGTIAVESAPGAGSTFTVTVPLGYGHLPPDQVAHAPGAVSAAVSAAAEPFVAEALRWLPDAADVAGDAAPAASTSVQGRVLVADDNADMREYLSRLLRPRYAVQVVGDGLAALAAALADPPDLVVSDVMMPGMDGRALLAALRADTRTARVPVLLLSARAGQEAAVEGLAAGADDYLVKPFSAEELLARVGAHLQLGRARREAEARFTAMADLAPALIWVADPDGARVFVNRGWQQFTGRTAEELGDGWRAGLHPQDRRRYLDTTRAATAARRGWEIEFRLRRADGVYHWLLERAVPIGPTEGWVGSCTDINARYRESERQSLLARLGGVLDAEPDLGGRLDTLARLMVDVRLADMCCVLRDGDGAGLRQEAVAAVDGDMEAALVAVQGESPTVREVVESGRSRLLSEVPQVGAPGWTAELPPAEEALHRRLAVRSALLVPLSARGRVLGVLALLRRADSARYDDDDRRLLEEVAGRAALAIDNAVLLADERATAARLGRLQRVTAELSAAATPADVAAVAVTHLEQLLGDCSVGVYELDTAGLRPLTHTGVDDQVRARFPAIPLSAELPVALAFRKQEAQWWEDLEPIRAPHPEMVGTLTDLGFRSGFAVPLFAAGRGIGAVAVGFRAVRAFGATERATLLALFEQCAQALDRARLYRAEHQVAETLQRSLLPQRLPELPRLALDARYLPGAEGVQAGGDWYDVIELGEHRVAIAVGDVVGQGAGAAAVMGQLRSALAAALLQGHGPAAALELLDGFAARIPGARASTAACVTLDWAQGEVRWARAGHPPPVLAGSDEVRCLEEEGHGPVLGLTDRPPYREGVAGFEPGATLVLYTDGLVERRGETLDRGLARLVEAVGRHADSAPTALVPALLAELVEEGSPADDIALIAARATPAPLGARLPAEPPQLAVMRRAVRVWAAAAALPADMSDDLLLALGEAAANAVEHAYRDGASGDWTYEVTRLGDGSVAGVVQDWGSWRPPPADPGFRGRGVAFVRQLSDQMTIEHGDDGTTVRFHLPVPPPEAVEVARSPRGSRTVGGAAEVHTREEDGAAVLEVRGEVDLASVDLVRTEFLTRLAALPPGAHLTLDLTATTYLASAGVGLLLDAMDRARAGRIDLRLRTGTDGMLARALALTGLAALADGHVRSGGSAATP